MATPKPALQPIWASTGTRVYPTSTQQQNGWSASLPPVTTYHNAKFNEWDSWNNYFNEQGISIWDNLTSYSINSIAKGSDGNLYTSLINSNVGYDPISSPSAWIQIVNLTSPVTPAQIQQNTYNAAQDVGTVNIIQVNPSPAYLAQPLFTAIKIQVANTNTGPATLSINGGTPVSISVLTMNGITTALTGGELVQNGIYDFVFQGSYFLCVNTSKSAVYSAAVNFNGSTQNVLSGSAYKINFSNVIDDPNNWWDPVNFRFVPTFLGKYRVQATLFVTGATSTQFILLKKTGSAELRLNEIPSSSTQDMTLHGSTDVTVTSLGDYFELFLSNATGGATVTVGDLAPQARFEISYLGSAY